MKIQSVVICFLKRGNKILLFQRSKKVKYYAGLWAGISGYLGKGEDPLDRAEREVAEETGLMPPDVTVIRDGRPILIKDGSRRWLVHPFLFDVRSDQHLRLDKEHIKFEWAAAEEISHYKCIPGLGASYQRINLLEPIAKKIEIIRKDRISGPVELANAAIDTLLFAGNTLAEKSKDEYIDSLYDIGWHLIRVRPNMAPVQNEVASILTFLGKELKSTSSLKVLQRALQLHITQHRTERKQAKENLQNNALKVLNKYDTLLTHSYSASVVSLLTDWAKPSRHLIVTESRPLYEGHTVARLLSRVCRVTLITEAQVGHQIPQVGAVVVGADSILADGSVVNKMGTYMVALAAKDFKKPFYVVADSSKFHPGSVIGMPIPEEKHDSYEIFAEQSAQVDISNIYSDSTPSRLINGIITESKILKGASIPAEVKKTGKLLNFFETLGNYAAVKGKT